MVAAILEELFVCMLRICSWTTLALKMEAISSKMLATIYVSTWCQIPEDTHHLNTVVTILTLTVKN
jgi:hypothetical protein